MDARKLYNSMPYTGMMKCARMILDSDKKCTDKELATMTDYEVCEKLLENYEVVSIGSEDITLVKKEDMKLYSSITRELSR